MEAALAVYRPHEPLRRHYEASHWLTVTGGKSASVHALLARIAVKRDQAAADQLADDIRRVQRARRHLREGVNTPERVTDLRAEVTREAGAAAADALIEAMRLEWRIRQRWW